MRALWLAIKPFYMSVCKHGFRSSFISYFIKQMKNGLAFFFILSRNKFYIWIRDVHECFGKGESVIFKYQETISCLSLQKNQGKLDKGKKNCWLLKVGKWSPCWTILLSFFLAIFTKGK